MYSELLYHESHNLKMAFPEKQQKTDSEEPVYMVRSKGVEPPWMLIHTDLNRARLPIPPRPLAFQQHILLYTFLRRMQAEISRKHKFFLHKA